MDLRVSRRAHQLVLTILELTKEFPKDHRYELASQLRRAATSVPANQAEGTGHTSTRDLARLATLQSGRHMRFGTT